ncbi:hypothetical protein FHR24_001974 [Wenyingzhuangia heitensis]|uniref:Alpha-2-macroglobulin domain-containing protein n=1 Tax=Wenyingzhuangia heitensis TaxID=1487859 RepID=A0ABX0UDF7_9FLAO|nr:MG2 domain-containing protein [Wenyingzhuangia heitensis]NIJ45506.1 hypothetical protein [Wenyingzhuangia heitensis]
MKKSFLFLAFLCLVVSSLITNCTPKKETKNNPDFDYSTYIYNHTSGINSVKTPIRIYLAQESSISNQELKKAFSIQPKVNGTVEIINQKQLIFTPTKSLNNNTVYTINLSVNKLFPKALKTETTYSFTYKTKKQNFEVHTEEIQSYNQDWQYILGNITTNDVTSLEKVKQVLSATQNKQTKKIKFDKVTIDTNVFLFKIDSIYRGSEDSKLYLNYNGSALDIDKKQQREIYIPGKNSFKIINVKVINDAEQRVEINFSDPIDKNQYLNGLISIATAGKLKFVKNGNLVKIYPEKTLKGELNVIIRKGIKNTYGYKFKEDVYKTLSFDEPKPDIKFSKSGNILPDSENLNIQFEAINLKAVDVKIYKVFESNILQFLQQNNLQGNQNFKMVGRPVLKKTIPLQPKNASKYSKWQTYGLALDKLINIDKGAIYKVELDFNKSYSTYKCTGETPSTNNPITETNFDEEDLETSNWDNNAYYSNYESYNWRERDDPCTDSYYANKSIAKNILATDIGLTVKKGNNNSFFIATNNTVSSEPLVDVDITFYNFQQQKIHSAKTNAEGIVISHLDKTPFVVTAQKNGQTTYVKVNDGNVLSMSNFNTNGVKPTKGIQGFIYTERGVWRPGDTIFVGFMLNDLKNKIPKGHPVTLELKDPNGVLKHRKVTTEGLNNLYTYKVPTKTNAGTGNWNVSIAVGGAVFNKTLKIETIKPNRLKINIKTDRKILSQKNKVDVSAKWLHGAIAKGLKVETDLMLKNQNTEFKNYTSYVFNDPSKHFETEQTNVLKSKLDTKGNTSFTLNPKTNNNAPGMLKAYLTTRVYENGGDFSTDVYTQTYSPFTVYTGIKRPVGDKTRNMLLTDKQHLFELVSVNSEGKHVANQTLDVKIYKMKNSWWYNNNSNYSQFSATTYKTAVFNKTVTTNTQGKANFKFEIKYPEWGRYFVKVTNKKSGHSTGESVFIDWPGWTGKAKKGNQKEAAMLIFTTDKEVYQIGEEVTVSFPSSENGNALITLENNTEVLKHYRIKTTKESTTFKFMVDKTMTPNIYINIHTLQPHNNTKNDLPIRMYGLKNISVENADSHLYPIINVAKEVEPETEFKLKVSEKNGQPLTYTIAIVDEGLLDLTRFNTPNPWDTFYAKQALGIKTWDMYDDVIGAFGGKLNQVFSIGGDQDLGAAKTQKANRFKPVVIFKGPFTLAKNKTATHKITLPKYIGAVKAMVVAHQPKKEAYGKTEQSILVKKPLMLLASAPRKVSQNEKIKIPITVFNSIKGKQNVKVEIKTNDVFTITSSKTQNVAFTEAGDEIAYFDIKALKSGLGKITIKATNKKHSASYDLELDAYNPISDVTKNKTFIIEANDEKEFSINGFGIENSNTGTIEVSTFPQINFTDRLKYLIRYPHGCLEQTTSAIFPQLYIDELFETSLIEKNKIADNINSGIQKLNNFQLTNGGFSYWPGNYKANEWSTNYAGHFLLEAEAHGFSLPYNFKNNWIAYQKETARSWRKTKYNTYVEQAYRLYTLALAQQPEISMMNRLRETSQLSNIAKLRLALAYATIGQHKAALELTQSASLIDYSKVYQVNHGSTLANKAIALETYRVLKDPVKARELLNDIAKELNSDSYLNTKTTAMSLLAVANYYRAINNKGLDVWLKINKEKIAIESKKSIQSKEINLKKGENKFTIENKHKQPLYVMLTYAGIPEINTEESISKNFVTAIKYIDTNGKTLDITKLSQGTTFTAEIEITNTYNKAVKDVAMTYQIPSGWELLNTRYATGETNTNSNIEYTDIRDNAIHYYFDINANQKIKLQVNINTTYLGSYYLPGTHVEAMYDHNFMSHTKGKWINVIP